MKKTITLAILCLAVPSAVFTLNAYGFRVPEPGNVVLLAVGAVGLGLARRRARNGADSTVNNQD